MNLKARMASALSFAHLTGLAKKADEEKDEKKDETAEEKKDPDQCEDKKDQDHENGDSKKSEKADDSGESEDAEDKDKKDAKKAEKDDDDKDEEMRGDTPAASARRRERARCAAIFSSRHAGKNPALAASLAFNTTMPRNEALAVLESTPAPDNGRGARNPNLGAGGGASPSSAQLIADNWQAVMKKVRPQ